MGGTLLLFDDFEDGMADGWLNDPPAAADWAVVTDTTRVYRANTLDNNVRLAVNGDSSWTDQIVEARIKVLSFGAISSAYLAGICGRFQDVSNYYCAVIRSDGRTSLRGRVDGSSTTLSTGSTDLGTNEWHTLRLEAIGTDLTVYLDGTRQAGTSGALIASGGIALITDNATAVFDDVRVTRP
jgi:hypothetical protein